MALGLAAFARGAPLLPTDVYTLEDNLVGTIVVARGLWLGGGSVTETRGPFASAEACIEACKQPCSWVNYCPLKVQCAGTLAAAAAVGTAPPACPPATRPCAPLHVPAPMRRACCPP